ncbi:MAG: hypothetical protein ACKVQA_18940 [Burkholderiales bacterium]
MHVISRAGMALAAGFLALAFNTASADPFCCECKDGKKHLLDESSIGSAGTKCTLKCRRPTLPSKGACEAPAPAAAAPAPSMEASASASLFKSEDCSGDAIKANKSNAQLAAGIYSYQVESGMMSAYEKANFGGASTRPVVGSMCVSPGWAIGSVKVGP